VIYHLPNLALSEGWVQLGYAVAVDERACETSRLACCCFHSACAASSLLKSCLGGGVCSGMGALVGVTLAICISLVDAVALINYY